MILKSFFIVFIVLISFINFTEVSANAREIYYVVVYNHNENCGCTLFFGDNKTIIGGLEIM